MHMTNLLSRVDDFIFGLFHLITNVFGESLSLDLEHFAAHGAEVKQSEHIDFQNLEVGKLIHCFLEFSLLTREIRPK